LALIAEAASQRDFARFANPVTNLNSVDLVI
jgi:hypothetical protein